MKRLMLITVLCMGMHTVLQAQNQDQQARIDVVRVGSMSPTQGPKAHFTGDVQAYYSIPGGHPPNVSGGIVMFKPGERTVWHTHPKGQRTVIIQGAGWVQQWGEPKIDVSIGDVIWIPPGVKHWHGATATTGMSHYAFAERDGDKGLVENMEPVTDTQYNGK